MFVGSNGFTEALDEVQYRLNEGPCLSAVAVGHVVRSATIGSGERRWPDFTPRASALALRSVVSLPIRSGGELVGSVNLYSRTPSGFATTPVGQLNDSVQAVGRSLSSVRLLALVQAGARTLAEALQERIDVDLAVGVLMDRCTMNVNQASVLLTQLARLDGVTTSSAARSVLGQDFR